MLLIQARRPARTTVDGTLIKLTDQDRALWDDDLVSEGRSIVRALVRRGTPGPYQLQAAINAVHTVMPTDWPAIVTLYDQLLAVSPTPVVALNRAVAVAEVAGPEPALALVDDLRLDDYYLWHAIRADLLRRLDRTAEAAAAYAIAAGLTANEAERIHLSAARAALTSPGSPDHP
jgi:RNA polymerase sigma-70 factor (ECF subfamily)